ncbi:MAG: hypothetical protein AAGE94_04190 [Acidobacteriota bacterium]
MQDAQRDEIEPLTEDDVADVAGGWAGGGHANDHAHGERDRISEWLDRQ